MVCSMEHAVLGIPNTAIDLLILYLLSIDSKYLRMNNDNVVDR